VGRRAVPVTDELLDDAAGAIARGFFDNEIWVWILRSDWQRRRILYRHYRSVIRGVYVPRGGAWTTDDQVGGALWLPPGQNRLSVRERIRDVLSLLPEGLPGLGRGARFDTLIHEHWPREPHWYLSTLSVEPSAQRTGAGTTLIGPGLERADADGVPAYLETQRRANVPFYRRFGFEEIGEIRTGDSPPLWRMWRDPR
jgi:GNAT superfamily N-acetyltransferase